VGDGDPAAAGRREVDVVEPGRAVGDDLEAGGRGEDALAHRMDQQRQEPVEPRGARGDLGLAHHPQRVHHDLQRLGEPQPEGGRDVGEDEDALAEDHHVGRRGARSPGAAAPDDLRGRGRSGR
jgi:hypothetical protein